MKLRIVRVFLLIFFLCSLGGELSAQSKKYKKRRATNRSISHYKGGMLGKFRPYTFATFNINALNYFGDLAPLNRAASTDLTFTRPGFGGNFGYRFHQNFAVRGGLNWGRIKGDDFTSDPFGEASSARYARNLSFRNDITELNVGVEYYIFPAYTGWRTRPRMNGYIFVGIAAYHHSPKGKVPQYDYQANETTTPLGNGGEWVKLQPLGTEGQFLEGSSVEPYGEFQLSIPIAIGLRMSLPGPFDAGIEFGYRFLFTDYIDDVSGSYVDLDRFDDPLARIMSDRSSEPIAVWNEETRASTLNIGQRNYESGDSYMANIDLGAGVDGSIRGNPDQKDMIFMTSLKLTYILGTRGGRGFAKTR